MEIDVNTWDRYELFKHFDERINPFVILSTPIDVTNIYNYCKSTKNSIYATFGYVINKAVNQVEGFKYRKVDGKIIKYDVINTNYTENVNDDIIGFFSVKYDGEYRHYIEEFNNERQKLFDNNGSTKDILNVDEIWVSCAPWFQMTSLIPPYDKSNTIPQFIWDKFNKDNNKVTTNLMIMVHHGFADGFQIGQVIKLIQEEINNFKGDE